MLRGNGRGAQLYSCMQPQQFGPGQHPFVHVPLSVIDRSYAGLRGSFAGPTPRRQSHLLGSKARVLTAIEALGSEWCLENRQADCKGWSLEGCGRIIYICWSDKWYSTVMYGQFSLKPWRALESLPSDRRLDMMLPRQACTRYACTKGSSRTFPFQTRSRSPVPLPRHCRGTGCCRAWGREGGRPRQ